jgi:hypothetical protein
MVVPLTPKPTRKAEALAKAPPTIASRREEDAALKEVALPRYRYYFFFICIVVVIVYLVVKSDCGIYLLFCTKNTQRTIYGA